MKQLAAALLSLTLILAGFDASASLFSCRALVSQRFTYENASVAFAKSTKVGAERFLGEGASARVFLVHSKEGVSIKKIYNSNAHGTGRFEADLNGLEELKTVESSAGFLVPVASRSSSYNHETEEMQLSLRMAFVPGRTVHDLLLDPHVSAEVRASVLKNYVSKIQELQAVLVRRGLSLQEPVVSEPSLTYFTDGRLDEAPMLTATLRKQEQILIKTDNVIVDPGNLHLMTVIDPY